MVESFTAHDDRRAKLRASLSSAPRRDSTTARVACVVDLVLEARGQGVSWAEVARHLAEAGIVRADGAPIGRGELISIVSRLLRAKPAAQPRAGLAAPRPLPPRATSVAPDPEWSIPGFDKVFNEQTGPPAQTIDDFLRSQRSSGKGIQS
ncbi:MAG: hypothetical protein HQL37_09230 [Alphaproteobacteria bacterium]|nr:hypothetical protein [Alphaproteobacteria bacterium]